MTCHLRRCSQCVAQAAMGAQPSGPIVHKTVEYESLVEGGEGPVRACLFCSIVGGRAPATKLYMDCVCCAFLTRRPDAAKHVLVRMERGTLGVQWTPAVCAGTEAVPLPCFFFLGLFRRSCLAATCATWTTLSQTTQLLCPT